MGNHKLVIFFLLAGTAMFSACSSCSNDDESASVSREMYDELQSKYDMLKESTEGTLSANEKARTELNEIMLDLNEITGQTITLQQNVESGMGTDERSTAERIQESIEIIKKRLNSVSTDKADKQTLALVANLQKTIQLNEQEIERLNTIINQKDETISQLDSELAQTNEELRQALENTKRAEIASWVSMGDELLACADLLPNVKGHGNMKEIKRAKLSILLRAKAAYQQAYSLGDAESISKIKEATQKYEVAYNR